MTPHLPEPVLGVPGVGFLAVQNGVPVGPFGTFYGLGRRVRFLKTRKIQPKPGERRFRGTAGGQIAPALATPEAIRGIFRRALAPRQRHQALPGSVERKDSRHGRAVACRIKVHTRILMHRHRLPELEARVWVRARSGQRGRRRQCLGAVSSYSHLKTRPGGAVRQALESARKPPPRRRLERISRCPLVRIRNRSRTPSPTRPLKITASRAILASGAYDSFRSKKRNKPGMRLL